MEFIMTSPFEAITSDEIEELSNCFNLPAFSEINDCLSGVLIDGVTSPQQPRMEVKSVNCNTDSLNFDFDFDFGNIPSLLSQVDELFQATPQDLDSILNEGEVGVGVSSASSARTGSQAFHYVNPQAVFETHGIPTLTNSNDTTTPFYKPKLVTVPQDITTVPTQPIPINTVPPYITTTTPIPDQTTTTTTKKKRKRYRKVEKGKTEAQKKRLYALEPLQDVIEEKKRKDAVRAKNCREKNRNKVIELEKKLVEMKRERDLMVEEVIGRRMYEKDLLENLKARNILMKPYGSLG